MPTSATTTAVGRWALVAFLASGLACGEAADAPARRDAPADVSAEDRDLLEALGYSRWSAPLDEEQQKRTGVVHHDREKAHAGLNLWSQEHGVSAFLLDMEGRRVHEWTFGEGKGWVVSLLLPGGDLLVVDQRDGLMRLDWSSNLVWQARFWAHHDLSRDAQGNTYVLTKARQHDKAAAGETSVLLEGVAVVDPHGRMLRRFDFNHLFPELAPADESEAAMQAYMQVVPESVKKRGSGTYLDTLHPNAVRVLPRDVPGLGRRGDLLISMRRPSLLALLDPEGREVRWRWGPGVVERQHHPTLLDNDHLLVFDNGSEERGWSRIVEYSPLEDRIVWEYRADPPESWFTSSRGSVQQLANGNLLITDSTAGEVFEVTRAGEEVWRYVNPTLRTKRGHTHRETIYRMTRIDGELLASLPIGAR